MRDHKKWGKQIGSRIGIAWYRTGLEALGIALYVRGTSQDRITHWYRARLQALGIVLQARRSS
jgi:hypothetical protein